MLHTLVHRLLRQAHRWGVRRRVESCPPALIGLPGGVSVGWRAGLRDWLHSGWATPRAGRADGAGDAAAVDPRLERVRAEFLQALDDVRTQQAGMTKDRLRIARSLRELWHLRPEVFKIVALHRDQAEAQCRLDRLNRHFPTRSPRSGFASLESHLSETRPSRRY